MADRNELPYFPNLQLGVGSAIKKGYRSHIALPVSNDSEKEPPLILGHIKSVINSLERLTKDSGIQSVSLAKKDLVKNFSWERIATESR